MKTCMERFRKPFIFIPFINLRSHVSFFSTNTVLQYISTSITTFASLYTKLAMWLCGRTSGSYPQWCKFETRQWQAPFYVSWELSNCYAEIITNLSSYWDSFFGTTVAEEKVPLDTPLSLIKGNLTKRWYHWKIIPDNYIFRSNTHSIILCFN